MNYHVCDSHFIGLFGSRSSRTGNAGTRDLTKTLSAYPAGPSPDILCEFMHDNLCPALGFTNTLVSRTQIAVRTLQSARSIIKELFDNQSL